MPADERDALLADVEAYWRELRPIEEVCYLEHRRNDEIVNLAKKHDLLGMIVPREYGGRGADALTYTRALARINREGTGVRTFFSGQTSIGQYPIIRYGNDEQKSRYLPPSCAGDDILAGVPDERTSAIEQEVRSVHKALPNADILPGGEAIAQSVISHMPGRRLVHLACHGRFSPWKPMASGNQNQHEPAQYPAAHPLALAVASTTIDDLKADFSNFGPHINLSAPGDEIVSTFLGNSFAKASGTSASTALASGAAALLYSLSPDATPYDIRLALKNASLDIDDANPDYAAMLGAGRLRIVEAVEPQHIRPGDLNGDGVVDSLDLLLLIENWGECMNPHDCPADLSNSNTVGTTDLLLLLSNWG